MSAFQFAFLVIHAYRPRAVRAARGVGRQSRASGAVGLVNRRMVETRWQRQKRLEQWTGKRSADLDAEELERGGLLRARARTTATWQGGIPDR